MITAKDLTTLPEPPALAMDPPPKLKKLPIGADLEVLGDTINENYTTYNIIANQLESLQLWIKQQIEKR